MTNSFDEVLETKMWGGNGFRIVESGTTLDENEYYYAVQVIEDADLTGINHYGGDSPDGSITVPAGTIVQGLFKGDTLAVTSGSLYAYIVKLV